MRAQDAHKPFVYSTGCSHAPHHVANEWADKYKGKFDQDGTSLRGDLRPSEGARVVPPDAELTSQRGVPGAWDDARQAKPFYARQMEVYAGTPRMPTTTSAA